MRIRSYLVGLAVIASSFIAVNPVEAQSRNGWYKAGSNLGDIASITHDLDKRETIFRADGDTNCYAIQGGRMGVMELETHGQGHWGNPLYERRGHVKKIDMWPSVYIETQNNINNGFYRGL